MPRKFTNVFKGPQKDTRPPQESSAQPSIPNAGIPGTPSRGRTANPPGQDRASNTGETRGNLETANSPGQHAPQQPRTGLDTASSYSPNEYVPRPSFGDEFTVETVRLEGQPRGDTTQRPGHSAAGNSREIKRKPLPNAGPSQHVSGQPNPNVYPTIAGPSSQQVGGYGTGATRDVSRNQGGQTNPAADFDIAEPGFLPPYARLMRARRAAASGAQSQPSGGEGTRSIGEHSTASSVTRPSGQYPSAGPSSQYQPYSGDGPRPVLEYCAASSATRPSRQPPAARRAAQLHRSGGEGTRSVGEHSAASSATRPSGQPPSARGGAQRQTAGAFNLDSSDEYSDNISVEDPFEGRASVMTGPQRRPTFETVETPVFGQTAIIQEVPSPRGRFLTSPTALRQRVGGQRAASTTDVPSGQVAGQRAISTTEVPRGQVGGQRAASTTVVSSERSTAGRLVPSEDVRELHAESDSKSDVSLPKDDSEMPREYPEGGYSYDDVSEPEGGFKGYKR